MHTLHTLALALLAAAPDTSKAATTSTIIWVVLILALILGLILFIISRYRMCPPDRVLVVFGAKMAAGQSGRCSHGGASFVLPIIQSFAYLNLNPLSIDVPLRGALSSQNIRVDVPSSFTVGISTEPGVMENAATRLLGRNVDEIKNLASEIIMGQMRVVIASMTIEEINADREKLVMLITKGVAVELHKVGLKMINANITDIRDASGYIEALGREAAARAINEANIKVAQETQHGETGRAEAEREQAIRVAEARAAAIKGENDAKMLVAKSNAELKVKEAEALRLSVIAERVQSAQAEQEGYLAQKEAELTRATLEKATMEADIITKSDIEKRRREIEAEATAEVTRRKTRGEADAFVIQKKGEADGIAAVAQGEATAVVLKKKAEGEGIAAVGEGEGKGIRAKLFAEAEGTKAILEGKAQGFERLVGSAGGDVRGANQLLVTEQISRIVELQSGAIKGLRFDKVVVMGGSGAGGGNVSGFIQDLVKNTLPLHEVGKSVGLDLPAILGTYKPDEAAPAAPAPAPAPAATPAKATAK
jgi:flotillin